MTLKASNYPTVRPSLDLNFAQTERLDPRITFSRASTGTYFDSTGTLQSAATDEARFDHDPTTGESLGLLLEAAGTNLTPRSQEFDIGWSSTSNLNTVTPNVTTAPDGTTTADLISETANYSAFYANRNDVSVVGGSTYTFSVFLKKGPGATAPDWMNLGFNLAGFDNRPTASFNLNSGSLGQKTASVVSYSITKLPNGWYRCHITAVATGTAGSSSGTITFTNNQNIAGYPVYTGLTTSNVYAWGAQVEASPYPTSYIPTTSSTVTRAADVATVTNSNVYDTDSFTIINQPFGSSAGASELTLFDGPEPIKRVSIYDQNLSQATINTAAKKTDEFWRWRILGSSFALPKFATDGQVTVDWGDGTVETLTTSEHTFSNGSGYHDIGFKLVSGTYFRPQIDGNSTHKDKVIALGPAPVSMIVNGVDAFTGCANLVTFDATANFNGGTNLRDAFRGNSSLKGFPLIDTSSVTSFLSTWFGCSSLTSFPLIDTSASNSSFTYTWRNCSSLTSFPQLDLSSGTTFGSTWDGCSSLTSFPQIDFTSATNLNQTWQGCNSLTSFPSVDVSSCTTFQSTWRSCSSLTSFPLIDTSSGTNFQEAWYNCPSLTSFPLIDTSSGTNFFRAWQNCSSLTSFPLLNTSSALNLSYAWIDCSSLTSFPLIDTSSVTDFQAAWANCSSLTSFPLIDTSSGTEFLYAWQNCSSLTSFPQIDTSSGITFREAWRGCSSLTSFPANFFDSWSPTGVANLCFFQTWDGCSSLTPASVVNILDSIAASGQSAPSGTGANDRKIHIDWDGTGTPATTAAAAITTLKSRNWEIYLNGVLQ